MLGDPFLDGPLADNEDWLLSVNRRRNQDHARVAAINHFIKRSKSADPQSTVADDYRIRTLSVVG
jgi:hypothetical protein